MGGEAGKENDGGRKMCVKQKRDDRKLVYVRRWRKKGRKTRWKKRDVGKKELEFCGRGSEERRKERKR